jgi:uncharacterized protein (DUF1697 family)
MAVYVALLRAIGPGTHEKMSMAALKAGIEGAGCTDVTTVGNTGNVILRSKKSPRAVRDLVQQVVDGFGIGPTVEVFIRTPVQMAFVVESNPFPEAAADHPSYVGVCSFHNSPDWGKLKAYNGPMPWTHVGAHLVRDAGDGTGVGRFNVEKILGVRMTERNWRVFAKLAEKAQALQKA